MDSGLRQNMSLFLIWICFIHIKIYFFMLWMIVAVNELCKLLFQVGKIFERC